MEAVNSRAKRPTPGLRRRQPDATRRRILSAATSEFAAKGLAGARVDEIAARARVSKRMLYHYFGHKEALWLAVLEHAYLHIRSEERELDVSRLSPVAGMRRLIEFTVGYVQAHPDSSRSCSARICIKLNICAGRARCAICILPSWV